MNLGGHGVLIIRRWSIQRRRPGCGHNRWFTAWLGDRARVAAFLPLEQGDLFITLAAIEERHQAVEIDPILTRRRPPPPSWSPILVGLRAPVCAGDAAMKRTASRKAQLYALGQTGY